MTAELRRSLVLAGAGLLAGFALVLALFGGAEMMKRWADASPAAPPLASLLAPSTDPGEATTSKPRPPEEADAITPGKSGAIGEQIPVPPPRVSLAVDVKAPTFDIIRVEPNGESVIAGRGAPDTTVEMLRDNVPIARALIDPSGQFALVPPALPPGSSEITLRITGADGQVMLSKESVAIVVSRNGDTKPLIALSSPDRPTVVLSQPEPVAAATVKEAAKVEAKPEAKSRARETASNDKPKEKAKGPASASDPARAGSSPVKVVSVDAEEGGRLYVTGQAPPGATVRLYLNETLVAPGSAGADGRLAFAIGRGVAPGDYRVRIDEVDSVSGKVKARSEVAFAVPAPKPAVAGTSGERGTLAAATPRAPSVKAIEQPTGGIKPSDAKVAVPEAPAPLRQANVARMDAPRTAVASSPTAATPLAELAGSGTAERADVPAGTVFIPEIGTAKIARGDNLWQISRRAYGKGTRYTVIFDANQGQIRNPDLIYPGQIFVLPTGGTAAERQDGRRG